MSLHDKRQVRWMLEQAERDGHLVWTGRWRRGEKVYRVTDAGREWAARALEDDDEDGA